MMKFFCIGDEDAVRGFRLAGIEGQTVADADEIEAALRNAIQRRDINIVIITDAAAAECRSLVDEIRFESERPLLVEIPGPSGPIPNRKSLQQIVQEAVGIRISQEEERK